MDQKQFIFKGNGGRELNDVIYPSPAFELLYHAYTFQLTPRTKFWRFGIRLSTNMMVEFNPAGRYINSNYPDLQIAVGDRPSSEWINPNKIELGNYHYMKGEDNNNPFNICNTYVELSDVTVEFKHDIENNALLISYIAKGCPPFQKELQLFDYKYFQIFAWADWIDFELDCKINETDFRYLSLPTIPLTEYDIKWLKLIYEKFNNNDDIINEHEIKELWDKFPGEYNPIGINPLLAMGGTAITLWGIYHIDPMSKIFENFDKVIFAIRTMLSRSKIPDRISSHQIHEVLPELTQREVIFVFKLIGSLQGFSRGSSRDNDSTYHITVNDPEILRNYRSFLGLQKYLYDFLQKLDIIKKQSATIAIQNPIPESTNSAIGRTPLQRRHISEFDAVMGVENIAAIVAEIIEGLRADKGQMIGVFGKWGRGKTFLIDQLFKVLNEEKSNKILLFLNKIFQFLKRKKTPTTKNISYSRVDYHAWKYQETPASWAYLYELIADVYLGHKRFFWNYYRRLLYLNLNRQKIWPVLSFLLGVFATVALPFLSAPLFKDNKSLFWLGITPAFLITAFKILKQLNRPLSTKAVDLVKKYGIRHSFKSTLGMQAAIQDELVILIKTWISKKNIATHKILLIVEDVDRCAEEKIIENIDALRVMLDNEEIAKRLIVITAVDERILKNAIRKKYESLSFLDNQPASKNVPKSTSKINELICEYLDKLFISAIKLGDLTSLQKNEYVQEILKYDLKGPLRRPRPTSHTPNYDNGSSGQTQGVDQELNGSMSGKDTSGTTKSNKPTTDHSQIFEGLSESEIMYFASTIQKWPQATPRTIKIFYYRYLLCKNLLLSQNDKIGNNIWRDENVVKGLISAILDFSNTYDPSTITSKKAETIEQPGLLKIPVTKDHVEIDREDFLTMLEIFEIIIAY